MAKDGQWKVRFLSAGQGEATESNVDSLGALRASLRPAEYQLQGNEVVGGHYASSYKTGALNGGGSATTCFLSFRWSDPRRHVIINRITVGALCVTASTTNRIVIDPALWVMRNFTVSDSGGSQGLFSTGPSQKRTTTSKSTLGYGAVGQSGVVGTLIVATTTNLTTGTGTNDLQPTRIVQTPLDTLTPGAMSPMVELVGPSPGAEHPLFLTKNEGFRIGTFTTMGTGTYTFYYFLDWTEVPVY